MPGILLIQTASIGDVILTTPVMEKLHSFSPEMPLDVLIKKGNESLFQGHPYLRKVLTWDKSRNKYGNLFKILHAIRKERYDKVINFQRFASTGFLTAFSLAQTTIGFDKNPWSRLFSIRIQHKTSNGLHETFRNLQLIESFTDTSIQKPKLYPGNEDINAVSQYANPPFICIAPTSLWETKQFPPEKWIEFLKRLPENLIVHLLGSKSDAELCENIRVKAGNARVVNLAGKLSMLQSAALMSRSAMNFVNDSAPMHLASAVNAPVTAVYCSTVPEFGFGPLSDCSNIVQVNYKLYCRPCGLHGYKKCPEGHFKCAADISIDQLLKCLSI